MLRKQIVNKFLMSTMSVFPVLCENSFRIRVVVKFYEFSLSFD